MRTMYRKLHSNNCPFSEISLNFNPNLRKTAKGEPVNIKLAIINVTKFVAYLRALSHVENHYYVSISAWDSAEMFVPIYVRFAILIKCPLRYSKTNTMRLQGKL